MCLWQVFRCVFGTWMSFLRWNSSLLFKFASFSTSIFDLVHLEEKIKSRPILGLVVLCNY